MRWIAHGYDVLRNVTCHHGPGADDGIRPDGHPRRDRHIGAEPHVITDGHGTGMLPARQAGGSVLGMVGCGDGAARTDQAILTERHISAAAHHEILVEERAAANGQSDAVVDIERRRELHALPRVRNKLMEQTVRLVWIVEENAIDLRAHLHGLTGEFRQRLRLAILRRLAREQSRQILVGRNQLFRFLCHNNVFLNNDFSLRTFTSHRMQNPPHQSHTPIRACVSRPLTTQSTDGSRKESEGKIRRKE